MEPVHCSMSSSHCCCLTCIPFNTIYILLQNLFISLLLPTFSPFLSISLALVKIRLIGNIDYVRPQKSFNFGATLTYEKTVAQILFITGQKNSGYSFSNRFQTDFKPFIEIHWNDKFTVGLWLTLNPILLLISFRPSLPSHPQPFSTKM